MAKYGLLPGEVGDYNNSVYGGTYGSTVGGPTMLGSEGVQGIRKIDPTKFGLASKGLFEQALGKDLRGLTPEQSMAQNPWVGLAQKQQALQQGFSRDAANRAPLAGVGGFRQSVSTLPQMLRGEIGQRVDIGQQGEQQARNSLAQASQLENIAFALAAKKKAGEELSGKYAEEARRQDEQGGKKWYEKIF